LIHAPSDTGFNPKGDGMVTQDQIYIGTERHDDALDTAAAAQFLGCSPSKLNKSRVTGGGPVFVKDGRSVRYIRRDLIAYRDARKRRSTSDAPASATAAA
jgi:hypothetical protein